VNKFLAVPECSRIWAAGDCAAIPDPKTGNFHLPTAQHALREGAAAAKNIEATILGRPPRPFTYTTQGQLATIGRRTGDFWHQVFRISGVVALANCLPDETAATGKKATCHSGLDP